MEGLRYAFFAAASYGPSSSLYYLMNLLMLLYSAVEAVLVFGVKFQRLSALSMRVFCFLRL